MLFISYDPITAKYLFALCLARLRLLRINLVQLNVCILNILNNSWVQTYSTSNLLGIITICLKYMLIDTDKISYVFYMPDIVVDNPAPLP